MPGGVGDDRPAKTAALWAASASATHNLTMGHSLPVCHQCQICQKYVRPCYSKTNIHIGNAGKIVQERVQQQQQNTTCCPIIHLILSLHDIKNSPLACPGGAGSLSPPAILHLIVASREFIARTPRLRAAAASPWQ